MPIPSWDNPASCQEWRAGTVGSAPQNASLLYMYNFIFFCSFYINVPPCLSVPGFIPVSLLLRIVSVLGWSVSRIGLREMRGCVKRVGECRVSQPDSFAKSRTQRNHTGTK